jgi:hypothetical protein
LNGNIVTMATAKPKAAAIAIQEHRIAAVGTTSEISRLIGPETIVTDLKGATVLPGFTDCHTHLIQYGLGLNNLNLRNVRSIDELKERVAEKSRDEVEWILGRGWDQEKFAEKRYPTRHDLDEASPAKPVLLRRICGHIYVANSTALNRAGVSELSDDPPGGVIDRDTGNVPTGILRENAMDLLDAVIPTLKVEDYEKATLAACQDALKAGLTSVHCIINSDLELRALLKLKSEDRLPLRFYILLLSNRLNAIKMLGVQTGFGDEWIRFGAIKIFSDGSLGARTAALEAPYNDDPSNCGVTIYRQEELDGLVSEAHSAGLQVAIHAIGDRAARMALESLAKSTTKTQENLRHRIEHASVLNSNLIDEFKRLGVIASVQPHFTVSDFWIEQRLGRKRTSLAYPFASLARKGVRVVAGSDCPVEPLAPLQGIAGATKRSGSEEAISVEDAISLYTRDAAYASFEENVKGTIEPGKYADLVCFQTDPRDITPNAIPEIQVLFTMVAGRIMYRSSTSI